MNSFAFCRKVLSAVRMDHGVPVLIALSVCITIALPASAGGYNKENAARLTALEFENALRVGDVAKCQSLFNPTHSIQVDGSDQPNVQFLVSEEQKHYQAHGIKGRVRVDRLAVQNGVARIQIQIPALGEIHEYQLTEVHHSWRISAFASVHSHP